MAHNPKIINSNCSNDGFRYTYSKKEKEIMEGDAKILKKMDILFMEWPSLTSFPGIMAGGLMLVVYGYR